MDSLSSVSNERLVQSIKESMDDRLLVELIQRFKPMVRKYASSYRIPCFDEEDYFQEARIVIYKACLNFNPDRTPYFAPYVQKVYKNHLANILRYYRAARRGGGVRDMSLINENDEEALDRLEVIAPSHQISSVAIYEIREKSSFYFATLSPFEKQVLCRFLNREDYQQIADELNIPLKRVHDALYRCRKKLKLAIE